MFVFEVGGLRIAHLGDLGHLLTDQQLSEIGSVDVVLIPVGGFFTIDAAQATKVVDQLKPRLIVMPMHYKTDVLTIKELAPVDAFLAGKTKVRRETGNTITLIAAVKAARRPRWWCSTTSSRGHPPELHIAPTRTSSLCRCARTARVFWRSSFILTRPAGGREPR